MCLYIRKNKKCKGTIFKIAQYWPDSAPTEDNKSRIRSALSTFSKSYPKGLKKLTTENLRGLLLLLEMELEPYSPVLITHLCGEP